MNEWIGLGVWFITQGLSIHEQKPEFKNLMLLSLSCVTSNNLLKTIDLKEQSHYIFCTHFILQNNYS